MPRILVFFRSPRGIALLLFAFALAIRLAGLRWGLPTEARHYSLHPDERDVAAASASLDFLAGDFNPDFFNYPSLFIYLTYFAHGIGALLGTFAPTQTWQLLHDFILSGRVVSALFGAATAPVVFVLTRAIFVLHPRAAVVAGVAAALAPGLVQHGHFATADVAATFFVALCLCFATRALNFQNKHATRALLLSAFCAGLAAATKYNAGLVVVAPLAAWMVSKGTVEFDRTLSIKIFAVAAFGFVLGCPGAIFYFPDFWGDARAYRGFSYELLVHPRQGSGEIFQQTGNGWIYHLFFNLPFAFTAPALLAAFAGIVLLVRSREKRAIPVLVFGALFFVSLGFSNVRFMRYVFPLVPMLCVGIGALALLPKNFARISQLAIIVILAMGAFDVVRILRAPDTRDRAAASPQTAGKSVGLLGAPWFWTPPFSPFDAPPGTSPQRLEEVLRQTETLLVLVPDAATLKQKNPDYVAISEFEWRDKERLNDANFAAWKTALEQNYELKHEEENAPLLPGRAFVPHDFLYTHPRVRIYRRK